MGQRGNYIIKENNTLSIYYTHWRANCILADLFRGEKVFIEFVRECELEQEIIDFPWLEGCVIIDTVEKELYFFSWEDYKETSLLEYYLNQLSKKWNDWSIHVLRNGMLDAEKILGIDYISKQSFGTFQHTTAEEILKDKVEEYVLISVLIKEGTSLKTYKTGGINMEEILCFGQDVIGLFSEKPVYSLAKEGDTGTEDCILVDIEKKQVLLNSSRVGLLEYSKKLWPDYELIMADMGYLDVLKRVGIETVGLEMSAVEVKKQFLELVGIKEGFNPYSFAERFLKENPDTEFNPKFFDNAKPRVSALRKLLNWLKRK